MTESKGPAWHRLWGNWKAENSAIGYNPQRPAPVTHLDQPDLRPQKKKKKQHQWEPGVQTHETEWGVSDLSCHRGIKTHASFG